MDSKVAGKIKILRKETRKMVSKIRNEISSDNIIVGNRRRSVVYKEGNEKMGKKIMVKKEKIVKDKEVKDDKVKRGKAYIYLRVSTKGQGNIMTGHTSLKQAEIKGYKKEEVEVIEEMTSGKDMSKMREFQKIYKKIGRGDIVFFYSVSRFSRNIRQALMYLYQIEEKGGKYYFCVEALSSGGNASNRLTLHNMLASAQYEREILGERVRASIQKRRKMGSHLGKPPFGFRHHRTVEGRLDLQPDTKEQFILNFIRKSLSSSTDVFDTFSLLKALPSLENNNNSDIDMSNQELNTYKTVSEYLNNNGFSRRNNKPWTPSSVRYYHTQFKLKSPEQ